MFNLDFVFSCFSIFLYFNIFSSSFSSCFHKIVLIICNRVCLYCLILYGYFSAVCFFSSFLCLVILMYSLSIIFLLLILWYLICLASVCFLSRLEKVYPSIILFLSGLVNVLYPWFFIFIFVSVFYEFCNNFYMYSRGIAQFYTLCDSFLFFILGFQFLLVLWRTFSSFKKCSYYCQHIV